MVGTSSRSSVSPSKSLVSTNSLRSIQVRVDTRIKLVQQVALMGTRGVRGTIISSVSVHNILLGHGDLRASGVNTSVSTVITVRVDSWISLVCSIGTMRTRGGVSSGGVSSMASIQSASTVSSSGGMSRSGSNVCGPRGTGSVARPEGSRGTGGTVITVTVDTGIKLVCDIALVRPGCGGVSASTSGTSSRTDTAGMSSSGMSSSGGAPVVKVAVDTRVKLVGYVGGVRSCGRGSMTPGCAGVTSGAPVVEVGVNTGVELVGKV